MLVNQSESKVYCWGDNGYGKLGIGNQVSYATTPTIVTLPNDLYAVQIEIKLSNYMCIDQ